MIIKNNKYIETKNRVIETLKFSKMFFKKSTSINFLKYLSETLVKSEFHRVIFPKHV